MREGLDDDRKMDWLFNRAIGRDSTEDLESRLGLTSSARSSASSGAEENKKKKG